MGADQGNVLPEGARRSASPGESFIERACLDLCEIALIGMVGLTFVEVVLRGGFHVSLEITDELGGYLLSALTFLSLPVALIGRAFHQVEYVQGRLGPRGRTLSQILFTTLSLVFALVLDWQLARLVLRSYVSDVTAPTLLGTPLWLPQSAMVLGTTLLSLSLVRVLCRDVRALASAHRESTP